MDSAIMAASERQNFVVQDEEAYQEYWMRRKVEHDRISNLNGARREGRKEGEEIGRREGEEIGRQEGSRNEKIEIARNALAKGLSIEVIHDITGLPSEVITKL